MKELLELHGANDDYDKDYLVSLIDPQTGPFIIRKFSDYIKRSKVDFDTIVCRGTSGLLVAPTVCHTLGKHLIISRKQNDGSHAMNKLEGFCHPQKYIVIDDLIASGSTILSAICHMDEFRAGAECVGIFLYRSSRSSTDPFYARGHPIPVFSQEVDKRYNEQGTAQIGFTFSYRPNL